MSSNSNENRSCHCDVQSYQITLMGTFRQMLICAVCVGSSKRGNICKLFNFILFSLSYRQFGVETTANLLTIGILSDFRSQKVVHSAH